MRSRFSLSFLFLATVLANAGAAEKSSSPSVRALVLAPSGTFANFHPLAEDKVGDAVLIGASGLSETFKPASRAFALAVKDATQESGYRAVAHVMLPEQGKDFILLLEPARNEYKIHIVDGEEPRFGTNGILFFNSTEDPLGAKLGENQLLIKPRTAVFAKAPLRSVKPFYQVTFYRRDADKLRIFANTRWPHRDRSRCYIFFYQNAAGDLTYQAVDEELDLTPDALTPVPSSHP